MPRTSNRQRTGAVCFENSTELDSDRLRNLCLDAVAGWRLEGLSTRVRHSRGADFSGSCYYTTARIFVNLGRHLQYPYLMGSSVARALSDARHWWKPMYTIELASAYEVVLFVFLHECYHLLVKRAGRNTRQKESMCDRFAARHLVDHFGAVVRDERGHPAPRELWDFQDVDRFVAAARRGETIAWQPHPAARIPVTREPHSGQPRHTQMLLFEP